MSIKGQPLKPLSPLSQPSTLLSLSFIYEQEFTNSLLACKAMRERQ